MVLIIIRIPCITVLGLALKWKLTEARIEFYNIYLYFENMLIFNAE